MSGVLLAAAALALTPCAFAAEHAPDPSPALGTPAPDPYPGVIVQQPRVSAPPVVVRQVPVVRTQTVVVVQALKPRAKVNVAAKSKRHRHVAPAKPRHRQTAPTRVTATPKPHRQLPSLAVRVLSTVEAARPQPSRLPALVVAVLVVLSAGLLLGVRRELRREAV